MSPIVADMKTTRLAHRKSDPAALFADIGVIRRLAFSVHVIQSPEVNVRFMESLSFSYSRFSSGSGRPFSAVVIALSK